MIDQNSINSLFDAQVLDPEGDKIGVVKQVYVDHEGGQPMFVSVATGLFGSSETFVPVRDAEFDGHTLRVPIDKATVKHAPRIDAGDTLSDAERDELWEYYERAERDDEDRDAQDSSRDQGRDQVDDAGPDPVLLSGPGAARDSAGAHAAVDGIDHDADRGADVGAARDRDYDGDPGRVDADSRGAMPDRVILRRHIVTVDQDVVVPVDQDDDDPTVRDGRRQ
ncbi:PRC-barrel domain-containing protein [Leucobacter sp. USHLN153]|uniref:PRC-barrel domain-containing protein n=1 Tax=Leucobacter sp. USHLN153 TaxID=3081268 RepID=UPI00301A30CB